MRTGLEPVTSCVTGRHSNQAELTHLKCKYSLFVLAVRTGLEPVTSCVTGRHSNQAELTHLSDISFICGCKGMNIFYNGQRLPRLFIKKVARAEHHDIFSRQKASLSTPPTVESRTAQTVLTTACCLCLHRHISDGGAVCR